MGCQTKFSANKFEHVQAAPRIERIEIGLLFKISELDNSKIFPSGDPFMKLASFRSISIFILFLLCSSIIVFAQDKSTRIDELMKAYNEYGQFNGSVLVAENGRVIHKRGYGLANMEWKVANEPDTKFRLASVTKQFTAAAILQLVDQGKIKLDGKITDYLPDYRKDTGDRVTIHQLLNHTSGIPSYTSQPGFIENVSRNPFTVAEFVKKHSGGELEFEPGTKFNYNNSGYFLLGAIIEKVSGKSYDQYLKDHIFTPLGMNNSGYDRHGSLLSKRASGYSKTPKGYVNAPYLDMSIPYSAGSLYSTVEDLYLWDQALYTDKLISAKSRELMFTPGLDNYGYGFGIRKISFGEKVPPVTEITHSGGINGFRTLIVRLVADKRVIILLDNTEQGRYLEPIRQNIANILYDQPYGQPKRSIAETVVAAVNEKGVESAIKQYRELKNSKSNEYDFSESELNSAGYQLMRTGKGEQAVEIFKLNVEMFPQASNPYDSLGEAYAAAGEKELAIKNYKRSVELDPKNTGALAAIKRLEAAAVSVDTKNFDLYTGQYQLAPNFILTIIKEGDKLFGQATGQPKFELEAGSDSLFHIRQVGAEITFVKAETGPATALILNQGGRKMEAKRIP